MCSTLGLNAVIIVMLVSGTLLRVGWICITDTYLLGRICLRRCPLAPIVARLGDILGICFSTALCRTGIGHNALLCTGRLCSYDSFVPDAFYLPFFSLAGEILTSCNMYYLVFAFYLHCTRVPVVPSVLSIFYGTAAFRTVNNVVNAVTRIYPVIGVIYACRLTCVIPVHLVFAFRTGYPVSKLVIIRIGSAFVTECVSFKIKRCTAIHRTYTLMYIIGIW